jgi:hypothetical protein
MLTLTVGHRAPPLLFPYFSPLTVTFPKLSVILRPLYCFSNRVEGTSYRYCLLSPLTVLQLSVKAKAVTPRRRLGGEEV